MPQKTTYCNETPGTCYLSMSDSDELREISTFNLPFLVFQSCGWLGDKFPFSVSLLDYYRVPPPLTCCLQDPTYEDHDDRVIYPCLSPFICGHGHQAHFRPHSDSLVNLCISIINLWFELIPGLNWFILPFEARALKWKISLEWDAAAAIEMEGWEWLWPTEYPPECLCTIAELNLWRAGGSTGRVGGGGTNWTFTWAAAYKFANDEDCPKDSLNNKWFIAKVETLVAVTKHGL